MQFFKVSAVIFLFSVFFSNAHADDIDISNPLNLVFVADKKDSLIDVVDTRKSETVYRIHTGHVVDQMVVTPNAPLLFYVSIKERLLVVYDLKSKRIDKQFRLAIDPRHLVLDTTGKYLAITDNQNGGIAVLSTYSRQMLYEDTEFPSSADVLFDPNEVDVYYTNNHTGSLGILELNTFKRFEVNLVESESGESSELSSPSRSLDGRYLYIANQTTGEVYALNAYSSTVYKTFKLGDAPVRPYTTPDGVFLYVMDEKSGRFVAFEQNRFSTYTDTVFEKDINLVTVGRFDRMNLLLSNLHANYYIFDNSKKETAIKGRFEATPLSAQGSIDGRSSYIAFSDIPKLAYLDLESTDIEYIDVTNNGAGAFTIGATNNVCH